MRTRGVYLRIGTSIKKYPHHYNSREPTCKLKYKKSHDKRINRIVDTISCSQQVSGSLYDPTCASTQRLDIYGGQYLYPRR